MTAQDYAELLVQAAIDEASSGYTLAARVFVVHHDEREYLIIVQGREKRRETCARCGTAINQAKTGRRRKYCVECVEALGHRTPATQARKSRAENAREGS